MITSAFRTAWIIVAVATATPATAHAQSRAAQSPPGRQDSAARTRLEGEIRRRFAGVVRQRLGLTDDQMTRLAPLSARHEQQRRQLQISERDARQSLRAALRDEASADPKQVEQALQALVDVQKRRAQLLDTEQHELAEIMSPVQRAKFMALQEQMRRRVEQMRQRRMQLFGAEPGSFGPPPERRQRP